MTYEQGMQKVLQKQSLTIQSGVFYRNSIFGIVFPSLQITNHQPQYKRSHTMYTNKFFFSALLLTSAAVVLVVLLLTYQPAGATQAKYTGHEDHFISLQEGIELTKAYRASVPPNSPLAHYFGKDALLKALNQPGCVGLRFYYGKHEDGSPALVVVGVDNTGSDMTKGIVLQRTILCPPDCHPITSPLQSDQLIATLK